MGRQLRRRRPRSVAEADAALAPIAAVFMRRWGDTSWRQLIGDVAPLDDPRVHRLVQAVGGIEDDAYYMQVKLARTGVLRYPSIRQFNAVWLTEETDHGVAFAALADALGAEPMDGPVTHGTWARDPRAALALPAMRVASLHRSGTLAGYLVRGTMVEHVAITVYRSLTRALIKAGAEPAAEIVRRIILQEGRHLNFFSTAAKDVLGADPRTAALVRRITERTWRPPGVDLYGRDRWVELFSPVLDDPRARADLRIIDERLSGLPGFESSTIVTRYLAGLGIGSD